MRGHQFELGEAPGADAHRHLEQALAWGRTWIEAT
jgi:hypothetical protein